MSNSIFTKTIVFVTLLAAIVFVFRGGTVQQEVPVLIILDTDISSDVDDVGAVAVLHALANQGKAQILAMMVSSGDPWSAPCLDALNTWFGRPNIPIGMIKGKSVQHESKYTAAIASEFPQDIRKGEHAPDAVSLYRQILSEQEDDSVTLVTVGYLTNLRNLLQSQADEISSLDGVSLVRQKVKKLVCMGGKYPEGREWNFYQDVSSTEYVLKEWPTPIIFSGYEAGRNIMTGAALKALPARHPVRMSYALYNNITDRPSWDQLTVLYAVEEHTLNHEIAWQVSTQGDNHMSPEGINKWISRKGANGNYLMLKTSSEKVANVIDQLMLKAVLRESNIKK